MQHIRTYNRIAIAIALAYLAALSLSAIVLIATPSSVSAASPYTCIVSTPEQVGTDKTPLVIKAVGSKARCVEMMKPYKDGTKPTLLKTAPKTKPVCTVQVKGVTYTIWGTYVARMACKIYKGMK
jgi:hypothetical protein